VYWLADKGIAGFVPFGTNGDGPTVATSEKTAVLEALVAADLRIS
jgi:4-hydroxy-tetrahydrodipicolinate synthase